MGFLLVRRAGHGGGSLIWQDMLLSDLVSRAITKKEGTRKKMPSFFLIFPAEVRHILWRSQRNSR